MRQTTGYVRHRANTDSSKVANLAGDNTDCQHRKGQRRVMTSMTLGAK